VLRVTDLVDVGSGDVTYMQIRAWLDVAALATSDLAEGRPRYYALNDANEVPISFSAPWSSTPLQGGAA
jgi:hypothetical protein